MSISEAGPIALVDTRGTYRMLLSAAIMTFVLASADLVFACTYWHELFGVPPSRVLQNIAAGLLGKRAFAGGAQTVLLGLLLQYFMMSAMVGTYYAVSRRLEALCKRAVLYGALYGVLLYAVMEGVVVPLSDAPKTPFVASWIVFSIVAHLLIGLSIAQGARWAAGKVVALTAS